MRRVLWLFAVAVDDRLVSGSEAASGAPSRAGRVRRQRLSSALAVLMACIVTSASGRRHDSDVIVVGDYYADGTTVAEASEITARIASALLSRDNEPKWAALDTLRMLGNSTAMGIPRSPRTSALRETAAFRHWASSVRSLLRSEVGPHMDLLLLDPDQDLVLQAIRSAACMGWASPAYLQSALPLLGDTDWEAQQTGAIYFRSVGAAGTQVLLDLLPTNSAALRRTIYKTFAFTRSFADLTPAGAEALTDSLIAALSDSDGLVTAWAARALGRPGLSPQRTESALMLCMQTNLPGLPERCAETLAELPDLSAGWLPALEALSSSPVEVISQRAVQMLGRFAGTDSVLLAATGSPHRTTRRSALRSLEGRSIAPEVLVPLLERGLALWDWSEVAAICEERGKDLQALLPALEAAAAAAPHSAGRSALIPAIAAICPDTPHYIQLIRAYWPTAEPMERREILRALGARGSEAAAFLPEVRALIEEPSGPNLTDALDLVTALGPSASELEPLVAHRLRVDRKVPGNARHVLSTLRALGPGNCSVRAELEAFASDPAVIPSLREEATSLLESLPCD
jgi:hypothetical protein